MRRERSLLGSYPRAGTQTRYLWATPNVHRIYHTFKYPAQILSTVLTTDHQIKTQGVRKVREIRSWIKSREAHIRLCPRCNHRNLCENVFTSLGVISCRNVRRLGENGNLTWLTLKDQKRDDQHPQNVRAAKSVKSSLWYAISECRFS